MIERLFLRQVYRELEEDRDGIHVSDLVTLNISPRLFWFDKNQPLPPDVDHALKLWQGKKLHEIVLGDLHEYEIEYEGIKGRIDDYISDLGILIDKKFVGYLPKDDKDVEKYYDHYILQLKLYSYMLTMLGYPVKEAVILFIKVGENNPFREYRFEPNIQECEELFTSLKQRAEEIIKSGHPPEIPENADPFDYPCSYCRYRSRCYSLDAEVKLAYAEDV